MPSTLLRQNLGHVRQLVVKLGTQLLTAPDGQLDVAFIARMVGQVAGLVDRGLQVTLVSSGAVGAGMAELGLAKRPRDVAEMQAVAAVGQPGLVSRYREALAKHGLGAAQLLLTRGDFDDRSRYLNIRNCVAALHRMRCVPVINENDTVAVEELRFGDNDMLAAMMCNALCADALVLLTTVDGLLNEAGERIDMVDDVRGASGLVRAGTSALGTGGMSTKLEAARLVTGAGEIAVIANGREKDVLPRLLAGEKLGTVFVPAKRKLAGRQRWIGLTKRPAGTLHVDGGAVEALRTRGKSLLARGVTRAEGEFDRGALVAVVGPDAEPVARGLTNYSADEVRLIMGKKSNQFEKLLQRPGYTEVIHRDHMVVGPHESL